MLTVKSIGLVNENEYKVQEREEQRWKFEC